MKLAQVISLGLLLIGTASFGQGVDQTVAKVESSTEASNNDSKNQSVDGTQIKAENPDNSARALHQGRGQIRVRVQRHPEFSDVYGFDFVDADPVLRSQLGLAEGQGVVVVSIKPGGLADQSGLKQNDLILQLNTQTLTSVGQGKSIIEQVGRGAVQVDAIREGKPRSLSLVGPEHGTPTAPSNFWLGVPVSPVDSTLRSHLTMLPSEAGLIVTEITPNTPAAKAGILKNDILVKCDGKLLSNQEALIDEVQKSGGREIPVELLRGGRLLTVNVTPEKRPSSPNNTQALDTFLKTNALTRLGPETQRFVYTQPYVSAYGPSATDSLNWRFAEILRNPNRLDSSGIQPPRTESVKPLQAPSQPDIRYAPLRGGETSSSTIETEVKGLAIKIEELRKAIDEMNRRQTDSKVAKPD